MKNAVLNLPDDKAQKELKTFLSMSLVFGAISLVIFWWLSIPALAFGSRALLLTWHAANSNNPKVALLRFGAVSGIVLGAIALGSYLMFA